MAKIPVHLYVGNHKLGNDDKVESYESKPTLVESIKVVKSPFTLREVHQPSIQWRRVYVSGNRFGLVQEEANV